MDLYIARNNTSLRQQVIDRLREAILTGRFAPGQKLVERDLCELLGISRTLLREALQHLGAEGLIRHIPHKGPEVAQISFDEAKDIYAVRESLEPLAGEGFALNASDGEVKQLRDILTRLKHVDASEGSHAVLGLKNEFYGTLLNGCGNVVVGELLTLLNNRITLLRRVSLASQKRLPKTIQELEGIVGAIEARDAAAAKRLCAVHVRRAAAAALKTLE